MKGFLKFIFLGTLNTPELQMFNPDNGEKKKMATGFSLQILFFGSFFGLPLFFKRLWGWAWGLFLLSTVQFVFFYKLVCRILSATTVAEYEAAMQRTSDPVESAIGYLLIAALCVLSVNGNRWAVEHLLKKGWRFENPDDPLVKQCAKKWNISKHYLKPENDREKL